MKPGDSFPNRQLTPGCDDKTILRVGPGPSEQQAPCVCPVGSGGVSTRTPGAGRQLYKGTRAGGAWGAGIPLVPAGAHPHTGLRAHLPRMNIPARQSLARIGLPHPGNITAPSHLLLEDQPEVPPPSCHSSPTHCAASFPRATGGTVRGLREVAGTQPQVLRTRSPAAARGVWV